MPTGGPGHLFSESEISESIVPGVCFFLHFLGTAEILEGDRHTIPGKSAFFGQNRFLGGPEAQKGTFVGIFPDLPPFTYFCRKKWDFGRISGFDHFFSVFRPCV